MWKKIINCIFIFFILSLIIFSAVQTYRLGKYRRELEQVRNELEYARSRTSDIRETFERFNEQEKYSANQSLQYQTLESKYVKLENNMKIWRTTSIILIPISIISTTITIILIESNI